MTPRMEKAVRLLLSMSMITKLTLITIAEAASLDVSTVLKVGDQSINKCGLTQDCDSTELSSQSDDSYSKTDQSSWDSLGLNPANLQVNNIAVGFVSAFSAKEGPNTPAEINKKLFKPMSIVGDYITLSSEDPEMKVIEWHLPMIKAQEGNPAWCITLMPAQGLESITYEVALRVAKKMAWINSQGIVVWLKAMHEMNGNWNAWGMKPELFKEKWNLLAGLVKQYAPSTYMLWSPNAAYGNLVTDLRGYTQYWPGEETVHLAAISFYHWGVGAKRVNVAPTQAEAVTKLVEFSKIYGRGGWGKPVVISETAACYTYFAGTRTPVEGVADETTIKLTWLHLLLDGYIKKAVPDLVAVIWFEIIKEENATGNTPVRTEDFRLVMGNPDLANKVRKLFEDYHIKQKQRLSSRLLN